MSNLEMIVQKMNDKGFIAEYIPDAETAKQRIIELIGDAETIGMGGSVTMKELGITRYLAESDKTVYCAEIEAKRTGGNFDFIELGKKALFTQVYLSSSNAVTEDGDLVNIDGRSNRVAALCFGPDKVIIAAGRNKITKDPITAVARIKRDSCPKNGKRLKKNTPCALTGKCGNCSPDDGRMCKVVLRMEYPPTGREVHVLLIDEDLGY